MRRAQAADAIRNQPVLAEVDTSNNAGVNIRDVAAAVNVSIATVSNVLNNPHLVNVKTRCRIEEVIEELGFRPNQHARELRVRTRSRVQKLQPSPEHPHPHAEHENVTADSPDSAAGEETMDNEISILPGEHVTVTMGHEILSGTVDAVMPDNSYCWIWSDNGMGRRLIDTRDFPAGN